MVDYFYMKDRQRVEVCLPAQMMMAVFLHGLPEEVLKSDDWTKLKTDLVDASTETVDALAPKDRNKLLNRTKNVHQRMVADFVKEDTEVGKLGLVVFHLIRYIIEDGYLQYDEEGPFARSIVTFMEALEHHAQKDRMNSSAMKQAKKMLKRLQEEENMYPGVEPNE